MSRGRVVRCLGGVSTGDAVTTLPTAGPADEAALFRDLYPALHRLACVVCPPERDPEDLLAAARTEAARTGHPQRWVATGLAAAAAVAILAAGAAVIARHDSGTDDIRSGPAPGTSSTTSATVEAQVFFAVGTDDGCTRTRAVTRSVTRDPVRGAIEALLAGPTAAEQADGVHSAFSDKTADALRSVSLSGGVARVDFGDLVGLVPNASTSCVNASILAQLDATVGHALNAPKGIIYSINGNVGASYAWLGVEPPDGATDGDGAPADGPEPTGFTAPVTAVASATGVTITDDTRTSTQITTDPTALAYVAGDEVLFQDIGPADSTSQRRGARDVHVWEDGQVHTLPVGPQTTSVALLDAGTVDGVPTALVTERLDGGSPDTTFEELIATDLDTGERRPAAPERTGCPHHRLRLNAPHR